LLLAAGIARKVPGDILAPGFRRFSSQANEGLTEQDGVGERERDGEAKGREP
jgi:hypothetical protein